MKTPITYYGGKLSMTSAIIKLIPPHKLYCEPFCGGAAVLFAKEKSRLEVINDLNGHVANFYKVLRDDFAVLRFMVMQTLHSRSAHRHAAFVLNNPEPFSEVKRAWAFWVQTNMSFSSKMFGGYAYERKDNSTVVRTHNKKLAFTKKLMHRLELVDVESNDALKVIRSRDSEHSFFYVDPPYFNSDCGHYKGYTEKNFTELLQLLSEIKGKFLLSSYPSQVLEEFTLQSKWDMVAASKRVAISSQTRKIKTEVLTANYPISLAQAKP